MAAEIDRHAPAAELLAEPDFRPNDFSALADVPQRGKGLLKSEEAAHASDSSDGLAAHDADLRRGADAACALHLRRQPATVRRDLDAPPAAVGVPKSGDTPEFDDKVAEAEPAGLSPLPAPLPSLTAALSRRRAIFGGLALASAPVASLPAVAGVLSSGQTPVGILKSEDTSTMSPDAAALLREFHDIAGRFKAAGERLDVAMSVTVRVPEPEALFAQCQDFWVLGCIPPKQHWQGRRFTYGMAELIAQLRALPAGDGDRRRADRRDEIVGAWDRWYVDRKAAEDANGETEASDHYLVVAAEHDAFLNRLVQMRTADPDVMKVKAALVLNAWRDVERFDRAVTRIMEAEGDIEDALSISLMRDVMAQLGAERRVSA